jgi:hypothetical protein
MMPSCAHGGGAEPWRWKPDYTHPRLMAYVRDEMNFIPSIQSLRHEQSPLLTEETYWIPTTAVR